MPLFVHFVVSCLKVPDMTGKWQEACEVSFVKTIENQGRDFYIDSMMS